VLNPDPASRPSAIDASTTFCIFRRSFVPLNPEKKILVVDAGTGCGQWVLETAEEYENADVYGIDISCIQPTDVRENCEFRWGDFTTDLLIYFHQGSVDFMHSRHDNCRQR
jgi:tRNA1(Val) A37 N6-methylase TrmN6